MKLQINLKGSWRDVLSFDANRQVDVRESAAALLKSSGAKEKMRISTDDNVRIAYCCAPDYQWRVA
ncbi:hypothetical protein [Propionivibrio limicola]|uniref:hypothetical protein n=1 Tax=Propionivibrio limicola TaxID=167645 RepID=UPI0012913C39|nr:hypothetical protein [Propionivibrio limicola]